MVFGFFALLLERLPLFGLIFSISNQIGAAMWAHDLEKRQHMFQRGELSPIVQDAEQKATHVSGTDVREKPGLSSVGSVDADKINSGSSSPFAAPATPATSAHVPVKRRVPPPPPPRL